MTGRAMRVVVLKGACGVHARYKRPMPVVLPPSLRKDLHPVRDEAAWARSLTPEQRLRVVAALCRDALTLLNMNPQRDRILAMRDPLPASTVAALKRLRVPR